MKNQEKPTTKKKEDDKPYKPQGIFISKFSGKHVYDDPFYTDSSERHLLREKVEMVSKVDWQAKFKQARAIQ